MLIKSIQLNYKIKTTFVNLAMRLGVWGWADINKNTPLETKARTYWTTVRAENDGVLISSFFLIILLIN